MKKQKPRWFDYLNSIAERITSKKTISKEKWQKLLAISDTFNKCKEGYAWAEGNLEMQSAFYQKMIVLQQATFYHKKTLAKLAKERGDNKTFNHCLDGMVSAFVDFRSLPVQNTLILRGKSILKLMEPNDTRKTAIELHLDHVKLAA